ncbi:MAG: rod shape-determining protein RodA [Christensenellales bacterium]|jgi:rod shape determining protein RodA
MKLFEKRLFKRFDFFSLAIVCVIFTYGLLVLANATAQPNNGEVSGLSGLLANLDLETLALQVAWFVLGLIGMVAISLFDYQTYGELYRIIYWVSVGLLVAVLILGTVSRGTQGWFTIGGRGFQPSELAKISMVIVLAKVVADRSNPGTGIQSFRDIVPIFLYVAVPVALVMLQPDWGTAVVYIAIAVGILFVARLSVKIILILLGVSVGGGVIAYYFLMADWQKNRIFSFLNQEAGTVGAGMQVDRSKQVIASGGISGKGIFSEGTLSQLGFLPEQQTDFIFSVSIETFGFIGGLVLIVLYALLIIRFISLAWSAKDRYGSYIIIGVVSMLMFHVFENIAMVMGIMPVTGIPLPFVSYGGSSMLTNMLALGLVQNVAMRRLPVQRRRMYVDPSDRLMDSKI